jgi:hypothetical protein
LINLPYVALGQGRDRSLARVACAHLLAGDIDAACWEGKGPYSPGGPSGPLVLLSLLRGMP